MMNGYSYFVGSRLLAHWADTERHLPSCNMLSSTVLAVLYDNQLFSMAPDGPCVSTSLAGLLLMIYHISCFDTVRIGCSSAPSCLQGGRVLSRSVVAALQGFNADSCRGMIVPSHTESHLQCSILLCYSHPQELFSEFWVVWSSLWKHISFEGTWILHVFKLWLNFLVINAHLTSAT